MCEVLVGTCICCVVLPICWFIFGYFFTLPSLYEMVTFWGYWFLYLGFYALLFVLYGFLIKFVVEITFNFANQVRKRRHHIRYSSAIESNKVNYVELFVFIGLNLAFIILTIFLYTYFNHWVLKYTALLYVSYIFGLVASFPLRSDPEKDLEFVVKDVYTQNNEVVPKVFGNTLVFLLFFKGLDLLYSYFS